MNEYTVTEQDGIFHYFVNGVEFYRDITRYGFVAVFTNNSGQTISKVQKTRRVTGQKQMAQAGYTHTDTIAL